MQHLHPSVINYWRLAWTLRVVWLLPFVLPMAIGVGAAAPETIPLILAGVCVLGLPILAWAVFAPPLAYRRYRYQVTDEMLLLEHGVIFWEERRIPINRLQHVDLARGPLERMMGLATLVVFNAGGGGATFRVPGLLPERASALRDHILALKDRLEGGDAPSSVEPPSDDPAEPIFQTRPVTPAPPEPSE